MMTNVARRRLRGNLSEMVVAQEDYGFLIFFFSCPRGR